MPLLLLVVTVLWLQTVSTKSSIYIMSGEDGWGDGSLTTSKSAYVRVTAWVSLSNISFHKTPSMHSPSINCLQNHNLTFPFLFDLDEDIISVQARALDGENEGYIFNGGGAVMLDTLNSFGGVVYAYSQKEIRIWHPVANNTYLIAVTDDWGHGNKSQYSRTAQVLFTIWKATSGLSGNQGSITSTRTSELTASTPITSTSCDVPTTINVSSSTVDSSATAMNACKSSSTTTQYTWGSCCFSTNTSEVLMNITQFLLNDLTVQKKNTSKYLRTLGSAQDKRTSARALGWFGGSICLSVVGVIILLDLTTICRKSSKTTDENTVGHKESKA